MTQFRRRHFLLRVLPVAYFLNALLVGHLLAHQETFPFATWSLFTYVPKIKTDFEVFLTSVNGNDINPPLPFQKANAVFQRAGTVEAYHSIQRLGLGLYHSDDKQIKKERTQFERGFLANQVQNVIYDVAIRRYNVVEMWKDGTYEAKKMQTFTYAESP